MSEQTTSSPEAPPAMTEVEELRSKLASFEYTWQRIREVLPTEAPTNAELAEAQRLALEWENKYFEVVENRTAAVLEAEVAGDTASREREVENGALFDKLMNVENERDRLRAEVGAARKFAEEMRDFCSPHGVATGYADRLVEAMDRAKESTK